MANVFLLGDSICQGYAGYVSEALHGIAEVHCPADNARFTTYQLKYLNDWLAPVRKCGDVDVFHFNSGLWDVLRIDGDMPLVGRESYAGNIRRLIHRVRQHCPKARLILAATTKVLDERMREDFCRLNKDVEEYNAIAADIAAQEVIEVDDLYEVTASPEFMEHREDGIHFTECGYRKLADKVFEAVSGKLMGNEACRWKVLANFGYYKARKMDLASYGRIVVYGYGRFGAYILHQLDVCPPPEDRCA